MKVTLLVEVETDDGMGFDAPEDVRSTLEDLVEDNIPSGFYVKIKVLSSSGELSIADQDEKEFLEYTDPRRLPSLAEEQTRAEEARRSYTGKNTPPCAPQCGEPHCPHCDPS